MTAPTPLPPPDPNPTGLSPGKKRAAIAINVLLVVGIVAALVLRGGDDDEVATASASTTSTSTTTVVDESDAFVTGMVAVTAPTTTTTTTTTIVEDGNSPGTPADPPPPQTSTTTTTTVAEEPPVLSGELDEEGIPVGLEFPLFNSQHRIVGGENLWLIAANQLAAITDRTVDEVPPTDIARYWERVIDENRALLQSGDPNLVYPGEVITFPGA